MQPRPLASSPALPLSMKIGSLLACLALTALLPAQARAFDYAAHCRMSNRALRLATTRVLLALPAGDPMRDSLRVLRRHSAASACTDRAPRPRTFAYGEWVAQVDWATTPADFFVTPVPGAANVWERSDTAPVDAIRTLANLPAQDFRVLHENSEHFGATALYSFQVWHGYAMREARRGALNTALVYQAFADHYLEDLFAPGHVFSPRRGLNDVLAGGIHNRYNRRGAYYAPERTALLAAYVADTAGVGDGLRPAFGALARSACGEVELRACVAGMDRDTLAMYGDNQLERSPEQELFVTLVIARSVHDVLEAWTSRPGAPAPVDSFEGARWCGYLLAPGARGSRMPWTSPDLVLPFGRYYQEERRGLPEFDHWPALRVGYVTRIGEPGGEVELSTEWITRAWPANWTGAVRPGRGSLLREDRTTYLGIDARIPYDGDAAGLAAGVYRRRSASLNRINVRASYLYGARVLPADGSVEPHLDVGGEVGFAVLHMELRPSAAYNSKHGARFGLLSGVSVVRPLTGKRLPPPGSTPPLPVPVAQPCR